MLILELNQVKKSYGERVVLDIDSFTVYTGDKIGLVGENGAGKTTLLEIMAGRITPDSGSIVFNGSYEYIEQLADVDGALDYWSGGERTLKKIDKAFAQNIHLVLADEPTSNLSMSHIQELQNTLSRFEGGLVLISHDRMLLNQICTKIVEIERGVLTEYTGNYDNYKAEKAIKERQHTEAYEDYIKEKARLAKSVEAVKRKADSMTSAPKRMGNSEARLHKNSIKARAGKVDRTSKKMESRLAKLEAVQKPIEYATTRIQIAEGTKIYAKVAIEGSHIHKAFGSKIIFQDASFKVPNGSKTALIGENGTGKTTLLKMIMEGDESIHGAHGLKIAYFSQNLSILGEEQTIYEAVAEGSAMSQTQIRSILARMLFFREDVFKPIRLLSGGERVKVALAKIFCKDVNTLILDEPNNYLDIHSMEALSGLIADYDGTILIVSHDRSVIELANRLLIIKNREIQTFNGTYTEYQENEQRERDNRKNKVVMTVQERNNLLLQYENRIAEVISKITVLTKSTTKTPEKADELALLDQEFLQLSKSLKELKEVKK